MLYIIRHGQTEMNSRHVLQGRSDFALNEADFAQAREAAGKLRGVRFDRVYSSPLLRAVQTAGQIAPGAEILIDERLIEMDYGPYEGADLTNPAPEIVTFFSDFVHNPAPKGMEQLVQVVARTGAFVEEVKGLPSNILVSTHAIAMKGILEYLTPSSQGAYWSTYIGNCAVYVAECRGGMVGVPEELVLR